MDVAQEKDGVQGMMRDPIGPLGAYGVCPVCGAPDVDYDPKTEISECKHCGFRNEEEACRNYEKRKRNGRYNERKQGVSPASFFCGGEGKGGL